MEPESAGDATHARHHPEAAPLSCYRPGRDDVRSGLPPAVWYPEGARTELLYIFRELLVDEAYRFEGFLQWTGCCGVIIDVGAHVGLFAYAAAAQAPRATIHCLEPGAAQHRALVRNVETEWAGAPVFEGDDLAERIHLHHVGAWSASTTKRLTVYPVLPGNSTFFPLEQRARHDGFVDGARYEGERTEEVQVVSLSAFFRDHGVKRVDLLKVDVEGAELAVLQGVNPLDFLKVQQVVVEADGRTVQGVLSLLRERGFQTKSRRHDAGNFLVAARRRAT